MWKWITIRNDGRRTVMVPSQSRLLHPGAESVATYGDLETLRAAGAVITVTTEVEVIGEAPDLFDDVEAAFVDESDSPSETFIEDDAAGFVVEPEPEPELESEPDTELEFNSSPKVTPRQRRKK